MIIEFNLITACDCVILATESSTFTHMQPVVLSISSTKLRYCVL